MNADDNNSFSENESSTSSSPLKIILPFVFIAASVAAYFWLVKAEPKAGRRPHVRQATLVKVTDVEFTEEKAIIEAMGIVSAAKQVDIRPQVRGEVVKMSDELVPGGLFKQGETMLRIDPSDYRLAIDQIDANVVKAQSDLQVEMGSQNIAQKEYEMLGDVVSEEDRDLVLRKPQFDQAQASLKSTQAALKKAKLNLKRTTIKAPFNSVIRSRGVDVGAQVTESTTLATLVGTDTYWVELSVPVDQLKWIQIPRVKGEAGSTVSIFDKSAWGPGISRIGRVQRLTATLEEKGRMARIITSVNDPLALEPESAGSPRLLIGSYVRVEIDGARLEKVISVPRHLIRDGNNVWIMTPDNKLEIRKVNIAFQRTDRVFLSSGITPGEKIIVTNLSTPIAGMALRTRDQAPAKPAKKDQRRGKKQ